jgi:hypothetical protein
MTRLGFAPSIMGNTATLTSIMVSIITWSSIASSQGYRNKETRKDNKIVKRITRYRDQRVDHGYRQKFHLGLCNVSHRKRSCMCEFKVCTVSSSLICWEMI